MLAGAPSSALAVMLSGQDTVQIVERRVLSEAVGERVMAAQEAAQADDHRQALDILNAIAPTSPYDHFIVDQLRARALFELDDLPGSVEAFEAALASGGANEEESYSIETAIFQLNLVMENFDAVRQSLDRLLQYDFPMSGHMSRTVAQAYVQMDEFEAALPYAIYARQVHDGEDRDTLLLLQYLYEQTGRADDATAMRQIRLALFPEN